ncbi:MAG: chemotaxis protein CheW [Synechococcaceae cyanobacterium SM2_3_2]|nr:chemotaxis protein CheW [Synechococcaceae cyanobacterium SM2_3_2]
MINELDLDLDLLMGGDETQELQELNAPEGELFLKFRLLSGEELALSALAVAEVMSVAPEKITPVPNVSPLLLGTLNFRGEILWVADLGQFLGGGTPLVLDRAEISVITVSDQQDLLMGLAVDLIVGMEWLKTEDINPQIPLEETLTADEAATDAMKPYLKGEWQFPSERALLPLLDQVKILRSERWIAS